MFGRYPLYTVAAKTTALIREDVTWHCLCAMHRPAGLQMAAGLPLLVGPYEAGAFLTLFCGQ